LISPKSKRNIQRIIPFGLIWLFLGWIFLFIEMAAMGGWDNTPDSAVKVDWNVFIFASVAVFFVGAIIGIVELVYLNRRFANQSFGRKILYKFLVYAVFLSVIIFIGYSAESCHPFRRKPATLGRFAASCQPA
jgi:adenylate cyclase